MIRKLDRWILFAVSLFLLLQANAGQPTPVKGEVAVYATPIQAGCYLAQHDVCRIRVEPFTINFAAGRKLLYFDLYATRVSGGTPKVIWDFRTDQSNPAPLSGTAYTPSKVARDLAVSCGAIYTLNLIGRDSGDSGGLNLGQTQPITCPDGTYYQYVPKVSK